MLEDSVTVLFLREGLVWDQSEETREKVHPGQEPVLESSKHQLVTYYRYNKTTCLLNN